MLACASAFQGLPYTSGKERSSCLTCTCHGEVYCTRDVFTFRNAATPRREGHLSRHFVPDSCVTACRNPQHELAPPKSRACSEKSQRPAPKGRTIDDLPFDVLSMIIELVVSLEQGGPQYFERLHDAWLEQFAGTPVEVPPNPQSIPSRLSLVNRTWRSTLFSMPSVWKCVVYHPQYHTSCAAGGSSHIRHSLERSCSAPLDATIWLPSQDRHSYSGTPVSADLESLEALLDASDRWQALRLFVGPITESVLLAGPFTRIVGRLSQLATLSLACDDTHLPPFSVVSLFKDSPRLRRLEISGVGPRALALPWMQIEELKTQWMQFKEILELMACCKQVQTWSWTARDPEVWINTPVLTKVKLNCLTSLDLDIAGGGMVTCVPSVLSKFSLPNLRRLKLQASAPNGRGGLYCSMKSIESLADLFANCTQLRKLELVGVYFRGWDLHLVLGALSSLDTLCLTESPSVGEDHEGYLSLLRRISQREQTAAGAETLLPNLSWIEYEHSTALSPAHVDILSSLGLIRQSKDSLWVL